MSQDRFQAEVMDELRMQEECMMPWTLIMADFLEQGKHWDPKEVATVLRNAQAEIDELKKEWQLLSLDEIIELQNNFGVKVKCIFAIEDMLKEKNNGQ